MITAIKVVSDNEVVVEFDNRGPLTISSDNACAEHLMEQLLSPRWDMTYSEYLEVVKWQDEITQKIAV